jgi:hypothetical protein
MLQATMLRPSGTHSHLKKIVYIAEEMIGITVHIARLKYRKSGKCQRHRNAPIVMSVLRTCHNMNELNPVVYREVEEALPHLDHPRLLSEVNI